MRNIIFTMLIMGSLFFSSCNPDDDTPTDTTETTTDNTVTAPEKYVFKRDDKSTVSFKDQTTRIKMLEEFASALKNTTLTETQIKAMFTHTKDGVDFKDLTLNASDKNIRSKTAASQDYFSQNTADAAAIKKQFDDWIKLQTSVVFTNWNGTAIEGQAGELPKKEKTVYVTAKGLELNQVIAKGLIGALFTDQILNHYLSPDVLDVGDNKTKNDAATVVDGKKYTEMEHNWDQAYGYIYGASADATDPNPTIGEDDSFLNKYTGKVDDDDDFKGVAENIWNAFKLGRAAIVAHNYEVRNEQAKIIRENISKVIAVRAVHYLQAGKGLLDSDKMGPAFHDLSEGLGFVFSLQFTRKPGTDRPYFTKAEVDVFLTQLGKDNGFWDVTAETLDEISGKIAKKFGFTTDQA